MHCLGCGTDLPNPKDRRALTSPEASDVVQLWRVFVENEDLREDVDIEKILSGGDSQRPPKMCKKCFAAYQTCSKYHQNIQSSLRRSMETLDIISTSQPQSVSSSQLQQPPTKRPRLMIQSKQGSQQSGSQSTGSTCSPDVSVSVGVHLHTYHHKLMLLLNC